MASNSGIWKTESSVINQNIAAVAILLLGGALSIGLGDFGGSIFMQSRVTFVLGVLLLVVGIGILVFGSKQAIVVDTKSSRVIIEKRSTFRHIEKVIHFKEISEVYVSEHGDKEGGNIRYYVTTKLKSGKEVHLFFGFFEGAHSKPKMEARCQRLAECLRAEG